MQCQTSEVEDHLSRTLARADLEQSGRTYWEQNECLILERFIPKKIGNPCLTEVELLRKNIFRNYVPGHKQGGSVSYYAIANERPESSAILSLSLTGAARVSESHCEGGAAALVRNRIPIPGTSIATRNPGTISDFITTSRTTRASGTRS